MKEKYCKTEHFLVISNYKCTNTQFLKNNDYSQITVYLRDGRKKKEKIKQIGGETKIIDDDYDHASLTDKWVEWMTIVARK